MKVTTEGCILGAWLDPALSSHSILDIGTGTGLLALMLAQKFPHARIDAVEVDPSAYHQAKLNFQNSPWSGTLEVYNQRIQDFAPGTNYDLIISNPPFFNKSLLSGNQQSDFAKHDSSLTQEELIDAVQMLLRPDGGNFFVLYPEREALLFREEAINSGFQLARQLKVYNTSGGPVFRILQQFSRNVQKVTEEELIIRDEGGGYSSAFVDLLQPYYLHL